MCNDVLGILTEVRQCRHSIEIDHVLSSTFEASLLEASYFFSLSSQSISVGTKKDAKNSATAD